MRVWRYCLYNPMHLYMGNCLKLNIGGMLFTMWRAAPKVADTIVDAVILEDGCVPFIPANELYTPCNVDAEAWEIEQKSEERHGSQQTFKILLQKTNQALLLKSFTCQLFLYIKYQKHIISYSHWTSFFMTPQLLFGGVYSGGRG